MCHSWILQCTIYVRAALARPPFVWWWPESVNSLFRGIQPFWTFHNIFSYICATRWAIIQLSKVLHPFRFHGFGIFGFVHAPLSPLYPVLMQISTGNQDRGFLCSEGFVFTTASINRLLAKNNKLVIDRFLIRNWPLVLFNTLERLVLDRLEQQPGITDFVDDMYRVIL